MGYINAMAVLPADLLEVIQSHIDGECIYIPRKTENKKQWGESTKSKQLIRERNEIIYSQYKSGISVKDIAEGNYLSSKTIYKIIAATKVGHE